MASKRYLRTTSTWFPTGTLADGSASVDLLATAGASVATPVITSIAGPITPPTTATQSPGGTGGTRAMWTTEQLAAITIAGTVTLNYWAKEDAAACNGTLVAELVRLNSAGAVQSVICAVTVRAELTTTLAAQNFTPTVVSTALSNGDRLGVRLYIDDGSGVTMAASHSVTWTYNGGSGGASGDSWIQVTEALVSWGVVALSEAVSASESVAVKFKAKATSQAETVTAAESVVEQFTSSHTAYTGTPSETVSASESVAALRRAVAGVSETVSASESAAALRRAIQTLADGVTASESTAALRRAVVVPAETVTASEGAAALRAAHVGVSETASSSEALAAVKRTAQALTETVTASDALAALRGALAALNETTSSTEALVALAARHVAPAEAVTAGESAASHLASPGAIGEVVTAAETLAAHRAAHAALAETASASEALAGALLAAVATSEAMTVADAVALRAVAAQGLADSVSALEVCAAIYGTTLAVDDAAALAEAVAELYTSATSRHEALTDTLVLAEALAVVGRRIVGIATAQGPGGGLAGEARATVSIVGAVDRDHGIAATAGARAGLAASDAAADRLITGG